MAEPYPKKYWWLVLVVVPLAAALIPMLLRDSDRSPRDAQLPNAKPASRDTMCSYKLGEKIFRKWQDLGGEEGIGCPRMDEEDADPSRKGTRGRWARFFGNARGERAFIFLHESGDLAGSTFEVHGAIGRVYERMGKTKSPLGFPVSDEYPMTGGVYGGQRSDFEGGYIAFDSVTRTYKPYLHTRK